MRRFITKSYINRNGICIKNKNRTVYPLSDLVFKLCLINLLGFDKEA
jgi:hypothetical protein